MIEELKSTLGIRDSMRLFAAADIVRVFGDLGEFSRTEVIRTLSGTYSSKCLDRAMADLESGKVLELVQACKRDVGAGASYRITSGSTWATREVGRLDARKQRHGRGGCRSLPNIA